MSETVIARPLPRAAPVFTQGSILRHVVVMTATGAVGLMAIFAVDLVTLFYVSHLGDARVTASLGYATQVLFFTIAVNIGLMIGATAVVSRALGAQDQPRARRLAASAAVLSLVVALVVSATAFAYRVPMLQTLGAREEMLASAAAYLAITLPSNAMMSVGMVMSGVLRAVGDARRAMLVTLSGGLVTAMMDPLFIFGFGLGVEGAAIAVDLSRLTIMLAGLHGATRVHDLVGRPRLADVVADAGPIMMIAVPAIATNLATPVANAYVLKVFSAFGSDAVAASTIIDRVVPVLYGTVFALSGSIGPILGQNLGAARLDRVRATLDRAFGFTTAYAVAMWAVLWLGGPLLAHVFAMTPQTEHYVLFFSTYGVGAWLFLSALYVANACFNNLGFPLLSLAFNWGRTSLGTVPFVWLGATWGGVEGGQLGVAAGAAVFGVAAVATAYFVVGRLAIRPGSA